MTPLSDVFLGGLVFLMGLVVRLLLAVGFAVLLATPFVVLAAAWDARTRRRLVAAGDVLLRRDFAYSPGHAWIAARRRELAVGLDDLARRLLPSSFAIQLPVPGTVLHAGDPAVEVRAGSRRALLPAPVSGTVSAVNRDVMEDPALVTREPYGRGWLYRVVPQPGADKDLREGEAARAWMEAESIRLGAALEHELGLAAADGGHLAVPPPDALGDEQWARLRDAFLTRH